MLYKAQQLKKWSVSTSTTDGRWIPCRPEGANTVQSAWRRIKNALGVMFGKYDAIDWEEECFGQCTAAWAPRCTKAPEGWFCTREPGHDGPCAAHRKDGSVVSM